MKDIFLFYFFSSLLPQLLNSYSRKPKDKKTLALQNFSLRELYFMADEYNMTDLLSS